MIAARLLAVAGSGGSVIVPPATTLYALFNGSANGTLYGIGAATSTDSGVTWTTAGGNPVITVGAGGSWNSTTIKDPWLLWDGSQYVCYAAGYNGTGYRIGRYTASAHDGTWTPYGSNPVIGFGAAGSFREAGVRFPTVLYEPTDTGKEWKMWFGADPAGHVGDGAGGVGYASSSDGLSWTVVGQVLSPGSGWEAGGLYPFGIVKDGSTYYLFVGGYATAGASNPQWQGGVVTFSDPEGTYTRNGGNPTLQPRHLDSGTSALLTATTGSGATVVTIGDTSPFHVNEAVLLIDGGQESGSHTIVSIDSGTQITITPASAQTYDTSGGTFRSFAYNAVVPRSILQDGSGWVMYGTPFQPQNDLGPGGTVLREGSLRWTASSLTGSWAYDYAPAGLLFPLYPANTGWDKFSAENPSVIAAP